MILKRSPEINTTRQVKKFAWFPVWVNGEKIWMEHYVITYKYVRRERVLPYVFLVAVWADWDEIKRER